MFHSIARRHRHDSSANTDTACGAFDVVIPSFASNGCLAQQSGNVVRLVVWQAKPESTISGYFDQPTANEVVGMGGCRASSPCLTIAIKKCPTQSRRWTPSTVTSAKPGQTNRWSS